MIYLDLVSQRKVLSQTDNNKYVSKLLQNLNLINRSFYANLNFLGLCNPQFRQKTDFYFIFVLCENFD